METPEKRGRGRPRQYDPDRALTDAADTFWNNGYAATSLDDLASATGMNRPSLYAAFGGKSDLYLKTLEQYRDKARALALELLADDPTLRVYLTRFYDKLLDLYQAGEEKGRGCYIVTTAATQATLDPAVREFLAESIGRTEALFSGLIAKARDRGEIDSDADPAALAQIATAMLHTLAVRSRAGIPRKQLSAVARAAIDVICRPKSGK
jgi:TetR/AcrR family transcriptional regulator, copper-responsive repressor